MRLKKRTITHVKKSSTKEKKRTFGQREREQGYREYEIAEKRRQEFDPKKWEAALSHKHQMRVFTNGDRDPGVNIIKNLKQSRIGLFIGKTDTSVTVEPSQNPDEKGSFGFIGVFVFVSSNSTFIPGTLVLRFDAKKLGSVARETLRLFRWDEDSLSFQGVFSSDVSDHGDYVWGRITLPGKYAIIGLHSHPLVIRTAKISGILSDLMSGLNPEIQKHLQERICKLILHSPELRQAIEEPRALKALMRGSAEQGFPDPINSWKPNPGFESPDSPDDICPDLWRRPDRKSNRPQIRELPEWKLLSRLRPDLAEKWESVGPSNIAGCIFQVEIDPADNNTIYVGAENGGLWRLDNVTSYPTSSWIPLADQNDSLVIQSFAIGYGPSDHQTLYVADGLGYVRRSSDQGRSWSRPDGTNFGAYDGLRRVYKIIVRPNNRKDVFLASQYGFFHSMSAGNSWSKICNGDITDAVMDPYNPTILYIGIRNMGLYKSYSSGEYWNLMLPWSKASSPAGSMIKIAIGRQGTEANRTVAVKFDQEIFVNHKGGRPESEVGGEKWVSKFTLTTLSSDEVKQPDWGNIIAIDPFSDNVMFAGHIDLYRTDDGGDVWEKVAGNAFIPTHEDQQSIIFDPKDSKYVYLSNDGGVFRSEYYGKKGTWNEINNGLVTAQFYHVGISEGVAVGNIYHSGIIGSTSLVKGRWKEIGGHSWEFSNIYADPARPYTFYSIRAGTDWIPVDLWRTRYNGYSIDTKGWINIGTIKPTAIAVDTRIGSNTLLVGGDSPGRIISALDGDKDAPFWGREPGIRIGSEAIVSIAFAPSNPKMAYAVSSSGKVFRKADVNDAVETWQQMGQWPKKGVRQLAVNALHYNRIYLMTENEVARSADEGRSGSWIDIVGSGRDKLPPSGFNSLLAHPADGQTIFLGTNVGVFISIDEGEYWFSFDRGLPNAEVNEILWGQDGYLYAATYGRGLWRRNPSL